MLDGALLFAQTLGTGALAAWMATGVWDNLRYPHHNEALTTEVLEMRRLKDGYPDVYADVAHRAVTRRGVQLWAFRVVVLFECLALLCLSCGTLALGTALVGGLAPDTARGLALIGTALFTAVWSGMLIVGNYFCYWFAHEGAQVTHFHLTLWGLATSLFLVVGS